MITGGNIPLNIKASTRQFGVCRRERTVAGPDVVERYSLGEKAGDALSEGGIAQRNEIALQGARLKRQEEIKEEMR